MISMRHGAAPTNGQGVYLSVNHPVLQSVPSGARSVLDIGCGGGVFGAALKSARACTVAGVTFSKAEARLARSHLDHVEVADLNVLDPATLGRFDCIVCSHVLEHLSDPTRLLWALHQCLNPGGMLIVALPNALHWKQRVQFMCGRFRYTDGGLMDRTHLRFFDWNTSEKLLSDSGYRVHSRHADGILPMSRLLGTAIAQRLNQAAVSLMPGMLGTQFVLRCQSGEKVGHSASAARAA